MQKILTIKIRSSSNHFEIIQLVVIWSSVSRIGIWFVCLLFHSLRDIRYSVLYAFFSILSLNHSYISVIIYIFHFIENFVVYYLCSPKLLWSVFLQLLNSVKSRNLLSANYISDSCPKWIYTYQICTFEKFYLH